MPHTGRQSAQTVKASDSAIQRKESGAFCLQLPGSEVTAGNESEASTASTYVQRAVARALSSRAPCGEPSAVRPLTCALGATVGERTQSSTKATQLQRAAIYARVSTLGNGQSPEMQLRELHEYCQRRGWQIAGEYTDAGISGAKDSRPELNRLMSDAHRRRFDIVCVWKFDRFARSVSHLLRALETFKALGIEFCSYSEQLDTSTPAGKMVFTVLGAVAELERSLIAERVRAGIRNAKAKGKKIGRPRTSAMVDQAKVRALRASGQSWRQIAQALSISLRTLHRDASGFELAWENPGRRVQDGGAL